MKTHARVLVLALLLCILPKSGLAFTLDPDFPVPEGAVRAMVRSGSTLYIAGDFSVVGGLPRQRLAAIDLVTGLPTDWNPGADYRVYSLLLDGSTLYVGGEFLHLGGQARKGIGAVSVTTGAATTFNPSANGSVRSMVLHDGRLYVGGYFTTIGGQSRKYLAALDASTGLATAWNPGADKYVRALVRQGTSLYVGGEFGRFTGGLRSRLAAFDLTTGALMPWNPGLQTTDYFATSGVNALAIGDGVIYVGGVFVGIGAAAREWLGAVDLTTGLATSWNPGCDGAVFALSVAGSKVYVGGAFDRAGGNRRRLAEFDAASGIATDFAPDVNGYVYSISATGSGMHAGGELWAPRPFLLAFDSPTVDVEVGSSREMAFSLRAASPATELRVSFDLPEPGPARIVAFDVAGRVVLSREISHAAAGVANLTLSPAGSLSPGLYLLRLTQGRRIATARAYLTR